MENVQTYDMVATPIPHDKLMFCILISLQKSTNVLLRSLL